MSLREDRGTLTLSVVDDGCGLPGTARDGLGTTLIDSLAIDLGGDVSVRGGDGETCVTVRFPGGPACCRACFRYVTAESTTNGS